MKKLISLSQACEFVLREHLAPINDIARKRYIEEGLKSKNEAVADICVSSDGTWHKRGYNSLNGIGVAIDILTG